MNKNFGKIVNGELQYAPTNLRYKNTYYCPADDALFKKVGYKKVVDTPCPDDDRQYIGKWEESSKEIVKVWEEVSVPDFDTLTPAQQREIIYVTKLICEWNNNTYTVDYMNKLWYEYSAEGKSKLAKDIQKVISTAKAEVRKQYPDREE